MKSPIEQLDRLARYLINFYGDTVKVDDMSNENAVHEAIQILQQLRRLTSQPRTEEKLCPKCDRPSQRIYSCAKHGYIAR